MGDTRRPQIINGLLDAVVEKGLHNCNMSDVAKAAGVSRGALHYYFKDKNEMISTLVAHLRDTNFMKFRDTVSEVEDYFGQLKESLWFPVKAFGEQKVGLAKVWIELWGIAAYHPDVHDFILEAQTNLRKHFMKIINDGIKAGSFRSDVDPQSLASVLLATLEGLIVQWHFAPDTFSFPKALMAFEALLEQNLQP